MRKLFFIITVLVVASCSSNKQPQQQEVNEPADRINLTDEQVKNAGIRVGSVEKQTMNAELKVNGVVDVPPQNMVSVSFPLGGYLKSTDLLPGMHVNRGQVIARIEDPALVQIQQDYLVGLAKLKYLEKEYERQKLLNENEVNAAKVFQQTEADFTSQKILVKGMSEKLRLINIDPEKLDENSISRSVAMYSPINGYVSKVNVNIGKYVNPADVLFELINPGDLHAALTVFEKNIPAVRTGQKVMVSFVDDPGVEYECEVLLVTKNVDDDRSALVHCHFEKQPGHLLPGMFLNARIMVDHADVLSVPEEAVVRYGETEYVFEAEADHGFRMLAVTTGMRQNGMVAIQAVNMELEGKSIVVKNAYSILSQLMNRPEE